MTQERFDELMSELQEMIAKIEDIRVEILAADAWYVDNTTAMLEEQFERKGTRP